MLICPNLAQQGPSVGEQWTGIIVDLYPSQYHGITVVFQKLTDQTQNRILQRCVVISIYSNHIFPRCFLDLFPPETSRSRNPFSHHCTWNLGNSGATELAGSLGISGAKHEPNHVHILRWPWHKCQAENHELSALNHF
jgi:hypothetical protein